MLKYIRVTVPYYIPIALGGAFVGIATSNGILNLSALLAFLSLAFLVAGFNVYNGITDFKVDLINKPYRPIPSGKITRKQAFVYTIILYVLSWLFAFQLTKEFFIIIMISTLITTLYSAPVIRLRKRFLWGNFSGAIFYGILCPLAGWSLTPLNPIPVYIIAFIFLLAFSLSITKDFEDLLGDRIYANKTLPVVLGGKSASFLTATVLIISFLYLYSAITLGMLGREYLLTILLVPGFLYLIRKMYMSSNNNHSFANEKTKSRTMFFILIGLGVIVEIMIGIIAFLI
jgi:geranylgeranylglycerol-phosphate geranylgeranyltransferase